MSGTDITVFQKASLDDRWRYAQAIAQAGNLVPPGLRNDDGSMNPGKVLMVMEQAVALGFQPMTGVNSINVIDGKVSIPPALMQAAIRNAGHKLRIAKSGTVEGGDLTVSATLIRSDDPDYPFVAVWTPQRAARAGLCAYEEYEPGRFRVVAESRYGKALPWQAYTEAMCKARAISEVCMEGATDVLMGAVYVPDELGVIVNEQGEIHGDVEKSEVSIPGSAQPITSDPTPEQDGSDWADEIDACTNSDEVRALWFAAQGSGQFGVNVGGVTLREAIERRGALLAAQEASGAHQSQVKKLPEGQQSSEDHVVDAEVVEDDHSKVSEMQAMGNDVSDNDADAEWLSGGKDKQ